MNSINAYRENKLYKKGKEMKNFFGTKNGKFSTLSRDREEFFWSKKALFGLFLGKEG